MQTPYLKQQRNDRTRKTVEIPEVVENGFGIVLWYYNARNNREEGYICHYQYGDMHFKKRNLTYQDDAMKLQQGSPVLFSGHKENDSLVVDKLELACSSRMTYEITFRLIDLIDKKWMHAFNWIKVLNDVLDQQDSPEKQTDFFVSYVENMERKGKCDVDSLHHLSSYLPKLEYNKVAHHYKKYLSDYDFLEFIFMHDLPLSEEDVFNAIRYEIFSPHSYLNESALAKSLMKRKPSIYKINLMSLVKRITTDAQLYNAIKVDLYCSNIDWTSFKVDKRIIVLVHKFDDFIQWYKSKTSMTENLASQNMDVSAERRVNAYLQNFVLFIELEDWPTACKYGFYYMTPSLQAIEQFSKNVSEDSIADYVNTLITNTDTPESKQYIDEMMLLLADSLGNTLQDEDIAAWRFIYVYYSLLNRDFSNRINAAFRSVSDPRVKTKLWATHHLLDFHQGFGEDDVWESIPSLPAKTQSMIFNRLLAEATTLNDVHQLFGVYDNLEIANPSIDKLRFFLNLLSQNESKSIYGPVISDVFTHLLIEFHGVSELEYYLPLCNYSTMPNVFFLSKEDDRLVVAHKGTWFFMKNDRWLYSFFGTDYVKQSKPISPASYSQSALSKGADRSVDNPTTPLYCEGRLVKNKTTGKHKGISETADIPYFWCYNKKCIIPTLGYSSGVHNTVEYTSYLEGTSAFKYGLLNVFKLWGNDLDSSRLSNDVCASLNSALRFFEHLPCRDCGSYMTPIGESNYAFYRKHAFKCQQCGTNVYLSHCLNPNCIDIVDSRDSVKCPNGLYICKSCLACCDEKLIENRNIIRGDTGQSLLAISGHKSISMYCPKCGIQLNGSENIDPQKRFRILHYLEGASKALVRAKGDRNGRWYLVDLQEYVRRLDITTTIDELVGRFTSYGLEVNMAEKDNPDKTLFFVSAGKQSGTFYAGSFSIEDVKTGITIRCSCGHIVKPSFAMTYYHKPRQIDDAQTES